MAAPSLGDIVTLANTMRVIVNALRESSEASAEYSNFIKEIESFCSSLSSVEEALESPLAYSDPKARRITGRIHAEVGMAHKTIHDLVIRMVPHYNALTSAAQSTRSSRKRFSMKIVLHRLYWTMFKRDEVTKVQQSLSQRMNNINGHLATLLLVRDTGHDIGFPFAKADGLEIIDLQGQKTWFNWDLCRTYRLFHEALKIYLRSRHRPGLEFLIWRGMGLYEDGGSNLHLQDFKRWWLNWKKVRPGMRFYLSLPQWFSVVGRPRYHPCTRPTCKRMLNIENTLSGERIDCHCGRIYHVHFIEDRKLASRCRAQVHHVIGYPKSYMDYTPMVETVHLYFEDRSKHVYTCDLSYNTSDMKEEGFKELVHNYFVRTDGHGDSFMERGWGFDLTKLV